MLPAHNINGPFAPLETLTATDALHNHLIYGYTAGLGMDVNLMGGLFMRAEWEYLRFTSSIETTINTVRLGLATGSDRRRSARSVLLT